MTLPTEDVAALVARLREGLDGVTPGPWNRCGGATPKYTAIHAPGHGYVVFGMADATEDREHKSHGPVIKAPGMVEQHKNAAHIALCSPDNIRALLDHIAAQEAALSTLAGERDEARRLANQLSEDITFLRKRRGDLVRDKDAAEARATTAEAQVVAMRELVGGAQGILMNCDVETGICCCGDAMENHGNPMDCGHSPVDHGSYSAQQWLEAANAALASADQPAHTALRAGTPPSGAETQESAREALSRQEGGR